MKIIGFDGSSLAKLEIRLKFSSMFLFLLVYMLPVVTLGQQFVLFDSKTEYLVGSAPENQSTYDFVAEDECKKVGGKLPIFKTKEQREFLINKLLKDRGEINAHGSAIVTHNSVTIDKKKI